MDEILDKAAGLGVGGIILAYVIATTGLTGVYALTAALSILGCGFGMVGGIVVLGLASMLSALIAKKGIDFIACEVVKRMVSKGNNKEKIISDIDSFPWNVVCSKSLRLKMVNDIKKMKV